MAALDLQRTTRASPQICSDSDRIAFVRHRRGTFLTCAERLFGFADFGALQVADFECDLFERRGEQRQRRDPSCVAVARDHLRSDGGGFQAQARADFLLGFRTDVAEGSHGARNFADAQIFGGSFERARLRVISSYHRASFRPKVMGSACMPWVRPICDRVLKFEGAALERLEQRVASFMQQR